MIQQNCGLVLHVGFHQQQAFVNPISFQCQPPPVNHIIVNNSLLYFKLFLPEHNKTFTNHLVYLGSFDDLKRM